MPERTLSDVGVDIARQALEPVAAAARRLIDHRYGSRGGPPPGVIPDRVTRERIVQTIRHLREPNGTWPTQAAVAEALGVWPRYLRTFGPWRYLLELAADEAYTAG